MANVAHTLIDFVLQSGIVAGAYPNDYITQAVQNAVKNADRYYRVVSEGQQRDPVTMANAFKVCTAQPLPSLLHQNSLRSLGDNLCLSEGISAL